MLSQRVPLLDRLEPLALAAADWIVVSATSSSRTRLRGWSWDGEDAGPRLLAGRAGRRRLAGGGRAPNPDLTVLNEDQARALAGGMAPDDLSAALSERLGGLVVVTLPGGATAVVGFEPVSVAAPRSEAALDTTGAGDAFAATLLAELVGAPGGRTRIACGRASRRRARQRPR